MNRQTKGNKARNSVLCILVLAFWSAAPTLTHAADGAKLASIVDKHSGAYVTVKFVLKMSMPNMWGGGGDQENETEVTGVMIDPSGLVLCSNTQLGGFTAMFKRYMGSMGESITAVPTDIKVLVGDDTEGKEAELIARDSELDLAWVRIKEPSDAKYQSIDLSQSGELAVGQEVFAIRRLGKYFGRAVIGMDGTIAGKTVKPRQLFVPSMGVAGSYGLPVFSGDGKVLGVSVMQFPDASDSGSGPGAMFGQMSQMQDSVMGFVLPVSEVVQATKRAQETRTE